jgi:co-chaperonin GroES (HSP10)
MTTKKIRLNPVDDNVVVILDPPLERRTAGGIYLPDSDQNCAYGNDMLTGTVDSVGPNCSGVVQGDRVIFHHEGGQEVVLGEYVDDSLSQELLAGTEFRILREDEIIATVGGVE